MARLQFCIFMLNWNRSSSKLRSVALFGLLTWTSSYYAVGNTYKFDTYGVFKVARHFCRMEPACREPDRSSKMIFVGTESTMTDSVSSLKCLRLALDLLLQKVPRRRSILRGRHGEDCRSILRRRIDEALRSERCWRVHRYGLDTHVHQEQRTVPSRPQTVVEVMRMRTTIPGPRCGSAVGRVSWDSKMRPMTSSAAACENKVFCDRVPNQKSRHCHQSPVSSRPPFLSIVGAVKSILKRFDESEKKREKTHVTSR